jgi:putative transposase
MPKKTFTSEQIINNLRQAEIMISQGNSIAQTCKKLEISEQTYYRWRKEYGGMQVEQAKDLKNLKKKMPDSKKL